MNKIVYFLVLSLFFISTASATNFTFREGDGGLYSTTAATALLSSNVNLNLGTSDKVYTESTNFKTLIQFSDIFGSNPGQISFGSTIVSATLSLALISPNPGTKEISIHN